MHRQALVVETERGGQERYINKEREREIER